MAGVAASTDAERLLAEQAALRRVATAVAAAEPPERVFALVSEEAARVVGAASGAVVRIDGHANTVVIVGRADIGRPRDVPVGASFPLYADRLSARAARRGRRGSFDGGIGGGAAAALRTAGLDALVAAPVQVSGALWGAVVVGNGPEDGPLSEDTEGRLVEFARLLGLAVSSAHAWEEVLASRARIVEAGDAERARLGRNLHDGAQQRLVSIGLILRMLRARVDGDEPTLALVDQAADAVAQANDDLRELARGLHPLALAECGLRAALFAATSRAPLPVELDVVEERFPEQVEVAAYYVALEAIANAAKHAGASHVRVSVAHPDGAVTVEVADDGAGGATLATGSGLRGLVDRTEALGGRLELDSPPGGGTSLRATFPL
ncbi:MAG TPA: histidine kinase [Gaiellaceae bacterium]|nr:histidine kinase [Gaiellaceae bacterium]